MKTNNLEVPWVVFQEQIYRADHKPAPFTGLDGTPHPDYHDGLVALAYTDEDKRAIAALPQLIAALESLTSSRKSGERVLSSQWACAYAALAAVKGEPQP